MKKSEFKELLGIELARRNFYQFCKFLYPKFYKKNREYLRDLCDTLQAFIENDLEKNGEKVQVLFLSMPPRHGKSFTIQNLVLWLLGRWQTFRVMTGSYNEYLSTQFSKSVRDKIQEVKAGNNIVYSEIFSTKIRRGSSAAKMWQTEASASPNYLATSPRGMSTGFGADLVIIDDIIKDAAESFNQRILEQHYDWFTNTILSRLEGNKKIIIIGTRWSLDDLIGRYKKQCEKVGKIYYEINLKAYNEETGEMLCPDILSKRDWDELRMTQNEGIFMANYQQDPKILEGLLYDNLQIYNPYEFDISFRLAEEFYRDRRYKNALARDRANEFKIDFDTINEGRRKTHKPRIEELKPFEQIISYTDTADEGNDYLCTLFGGIYKRKLYLIDVVYTQANMDITEKIVAEKIHELESDYNVFESNNGGVGFAKSVRNRLRTIYNNFATIDWFHQRKNKMSRIKTAQSKVKYKVYFPADWGERYKEFAAAIMLFKADGHNLHDDAPDALTGLVETAEKKKLI